MSAQPLHNDLPPHLAVVYNDRTTFMAERQAPPSIPAFEGKPVTLTAAKISSVGALDLEGAVFALDETLKVVIEVRVQGVDHIANESTGKLTRRHLFKALDAKVVEWDVDLGALRGEL